MQKVRKAQKVKKTFRVEIGKRGEGENFSHTDLMPDKVSHEGCQNGAEIKVELDTYLGGLGHYWTLSCRQCGESTRFPLECYKTDLMELAIEGGEKTFEPEWPFKDPICITVS